LPFRTFSGEFATTSVISSIESATTSFGVAGRMS
jgi:hypothetical protein